jgi:hypothetical protein
MIPAFEWAKTVHTLDRAAIVIGPDKHGIVFFVYIRLNFIL